MTVDISSKTMEANDWNISGDGHLNCPVIFIGEEQFFTVIRVKIPSAACYNIYTDLKQKTQTFKDAYLGIGGGKMVK